MNTAIILDVVVIKSNSLSRKNRIGSVTHKQLLFAKIQSIQNMCVWECVCVFVWVCMCVCTHRFPLLVGRLGSNPTGISMGVVLRISFEDIGANSSVRFISRCLVTFSLHLVIAMCVLWKQTTV